MKTGRPFGAALVAGSMSASAASGEDLAFIKYHNVDFVEATAEAVGTGPEFNTAVVVKVNFLLAVSAANAFNMGADSCFFCHSRHFVKSFITGA